MLFTYLVKKHDHILINLSFVAKVIKDTFLGAIDILCQFHRQLSFGLSIPSPHAWAILLGCMDSSSLFPPPNPFLLVSVFRQALPVWASCSPAVPAPTSAGKTGFVRWAQCLWVSPLSSRPCCPPEQFPEGYSQAGFLNKPSSVLLKSRIFILLFTFLAPLGILILRSYSHCHQGCHWPVYCLLVLSCFWITNLASGSKSNKTQQNTTKATNNKTKQKKTQPKQTLFMPHQNCLDCLYPGKWLFQTAERFYIPKKAGPTIMSFLLLS